ncbi:glutaredoxin 3 [Inmirania thermothiophila]|uniref:Glutaredoxin n=2 Tax=Inmirania thermothiophila TaxID=1750597 RepID=A0A3N1Y5Y2_9GAMM|nr:glutaredoxin 3 [Inmirania thermothiophila]
MYATGSCPYCMRARRLLERKGVHWREIRVDEEPHRWAEMERLSGRGTVPQVFIDGRPVGGFDDLAELDLEGELDRLLGLDGGRASA